MKRISGVLLLLAGLSGCVNTDLKTGASPFGKPTPAKKMTQYTGPYGEPIGPGNMPQQGMSPGLLPQSFITGNAPKAGTNLIQAGYLKKEDCPDCDRGIRQANFNGPPNYPNYVNGQGILPVPPMGPPGAVALATGALPFQMPQQVINMRTSVNFASPDGMRVTWFGPNGWNDSPLVTPARYNFLQGGAYRLRLSSVANRLEKVYYPTLEIVPAQESSLTYLAHSSVPVTFTDEDFEQVDSGNMLVKVVYLPNLQNQDYATVIGVNELVSTRLEPGIDPIVEAQRRGTILLIIRMGNIDLNAPGSPPMDAPSGYSMPPRPPVMGVPPPGPGERKMDMNNPLPNSNSPGPMNPLISNPANPLIPKSETDLKMLPPAPNVEVPKSLPNPPKIEESKPEEKKENARPTVLPTLP